MESSDPISDKRSQPTEEASRPDASGDRYAHLAQPPDIIRWDLGERMTFDRPKDRLCVFRLGQELWALAGHWSNGIEEIEDPTPIPLTPPHLIGLAHVRGNLVPVVDISAHLGIVDKTKRPIGEPENTYSTLLLCVDEIDLCLVVDEVVAFEPFALETLGSFEDRDQETGGPSNASDLPEGWLAGWADLPEQGRCRALDLPNVVQDLRLKPDSPTVRTP